MMVIGRGGGVVHYKGKKHTRISFRSAFLFLNESKRVVSYNEPIFSNIRRITVVTPDFI